MYTKNEGNKDRPYNIRKYTAQYEEIKNLSYDLIDELSMIISISSQVESQNKSPNVNQTSSIIVIRTTKTVNISGCDECFDCVIENYLSVNS
ncbi:unnamed protein product [Rhizophagus irregularis]|nr:unnamed protein product [Rhizophagus irregularis]